ncbi:uncharacterized protein LOC144768704 [Lissotriton helveticus]
MELSDEQIVIKARDVAMRRGWSFVIEILLRTEIESFPHTVPNEGEQEKLGKLEGYCPQSPHKADDLRANVDKSSFGTSTVDSNNEMPSQESNFFTSAMDSDQPMVSQESEDEEEKTSDVNVPGLNIAEVGVQKSELLLTEDSSSTIPSSCKKSTIQREEECHVEKPVMHAKILAFIDEVSIVFNKCFFGMKASTSAPAPLNMDFKEGRSYILPDRSMLDSSEDAQTEVLSLSSENDKEMTEQERSTAKLAQQKCTTTSTEGAVVAAPQMAATMPVQVKALGEQQVSNIGKRQGVFPSGDGPVPWKKTVYGAEQYCYYCGTQGHFGGVCSAKYKYEKAQGWLALQGHLGLQQMQWAPQQPLQDQWTLQQRQMLCNTLQVVGNTSGGPTPAYMGGVTVQEGYYFSAEPQCPEGNQPIAVHNEEADGQPLYVHSYW